MSVPEITVDEVKQLVEQGGVALVDVREGSAFKEGHIPGAVSLHNGNAGLFQALAPKDKPVVVYCYKGNSSKAVTEHFLSKGFQDVKSMSGGFEAWRGADGAQAKEAAQGEAPAGFSVSELAKEKLTGYLGGEPEGTCVRLSLESTGFGLALDTPQAEDLRFSSNGLEFVVDLALAPALAGLEVGFSESVKSAGFTLEGGTLPEPPGKAELLEDVKQRIADNKIMLFMKGTAQQPMCGFSATTVQVLKSLGKPFGDKNVLEVPQYRYVLSEHSSWPTIPQVFIGGKFVGGCDIVHELYRSGELQKKADAAFAAQA